MAFFDRNWQLIVRKALGFIALSLALLALVPAMAQPVRGAKYADFLPMGSGRSVPLPEGSWELTQTATLARAGFDWEVFVLRNGQPDAAIPVMVVRQSNRPVKWGDTACNTDKANTTQFMVNTHNTLSTQLINKCSRLFALDNFERWLQSKSTQDSEYWKESLAGVIEPGRPKNQGVFYAEMRVQAFNSLGLELTLFVNAPKGTVPSASRDNYKAGAINIEHQILGNWLSIYVELVEQAFLNKSPQKLIALQFPAATKVANAPPPVPPPVPAADLQTLGNNRPNRTSGAVAALDKADLPRPAVAPASSPNTELHTLGNNRPNRTSGDVASLGNTETAAKPASASVAVAAAPLPTPTPAPPLAAAPAAAASSPSNTASTTNTAAAEAAKIDVERKAIEKDKLELAQQLEKMQQMLAQLQKANADAAKAAQAAQAASAAAASTPAKPAVPQVFANRKALVIGNDLYTDVSKLNNAGADAEAMAKALAEVGYQVTKHLNVSEKAFKVALRDFRAKVQGGDEVLFFYAGHGVQLANANYLLPVDIKGDSEEQIKDDAIQLQRFLEDMQDKKTKFALAVIDACRDNPFKGQGRAIGGRGLAPTTAATGQMVMFSAGSGQQALDKLGPKDPDKNGLFTRIFVKEMRKPGVSVDRVLRNVRNQVVEQAKSVGHEQTPALYDQSIGEFYFSN